MLRLGSAYTLRNEQKFLHENHNEVEAWRRRVENINSHNLQCYVDAFFQYDLSVYLYCFPVSSVFE
jgi:hypothetical protein